MLYDAGLVNLVNLMLSLVIFLLGTGRYKRSGSECAGYISIAFGVFAMSHIMTLHDYQTDWIFAVRVIGYLMAVIALSKMEGKK